MFAWGTCIDYIRLYEVWDTLRKKYTKAQWREAQSVWEHQAYLSPIVGLMANFVEQQLRHKRWRTRKCIP